LAANLGLLEANAALAGEIAFELEASSKAGRAGSPPGQKDADRALRRS
jgi:hypothetical protein